MRDSVRWPLPFRVSSVVWRKESRGKVVVVIAPGYRRVCVLPGSRPWRASYAVYWPTPFHLLGRRFRLGERLLRFTVEISRLPSRSRFI